jgi:hypothetical protein
MTSIPKTASHDTVLTRLAQQLAEIQSGDSIPYLTLFLAFVFGFDAWQFQLTIQLAVLCTLLVPRIARTPALWGVVAIVATATLLKERNLADNHKYLLCYWLWVMCIAHIPNEAEFRDRILRFNARFFLIFIFLAAAAQKFSSVTYMSGSMFGMQLLVDGRFQAFAHLIGIEPGLSDESLRRLLLLQNSYVQVVDNHVKLSSNDHVHYVARLVTLYDFYVQVAIGVLLLFCRRMTDIAAHVLILFFIVTTYLPAPVFGFGMTLSILGFTIAKDRFRSIGTAYLFTIVAVLVYQVPWRNWVLGVGL